MSENKKKGRQRIHANGAEKIKAWRKKNKELVRHDIYITPSATWRIKALAKAWSCTPAKVIERLTMEADSKYENILFPENDKI